MIDSSSILIPKSLNPVCATRAGWVAIVNYGQPPNNSDDSNGSSGDQSPPLDNPYYREQPQTIQVIDHYEYQINDQPQIDQLTQQLKGLNYYTDIKSYWDGYAYDYFVDFYGPDAKQASDINYKREQLRSAEYLAIYKDISNPNYIPIEQNGDNQDILALGYLDKSINWSFSMYYLHGQINQSVNSYNIETRALIVSADFIYCGCCDCQLSSNNNCISLATVAKAVLQFAALAT